MPSFPVLAADTIVVLKDKIFGKPESESDAIAMLLKLSDKTHVVITAVTVGIINKEQAKFHTISVSSNVEFATLTEVDCKEYCKTNEPFDKAGSYGFDCRICHQKIMKLFHIVGLPIHEVVELLKELGISYWNKK